MASEQVVSIDTEKNPYKKLTTMKKTQHLMNGGLHFSTGQL